MNNSCTSEESTLSSGHFLVRQRACPQGAEGAGEPFSWPRCLENILGWFCSQGPGLPGSAGAELAGGCVTAAVAWLPWVQLPWLEELYSPGSSVLGVARLWFTWSQGLAESFSLAWAQTDCSVWDWWDVSSKTLLFWSGVTPLLFTKLFTRLFSCCS